MAPPSRSPRPPWQSLAAPGALALALHGCLFGGALAVVGGSEPSPAGATALTVRRIEPAPPAVQALPAMPTIEPTAAAPRFARATPRSARAPVEDAGGRPGALPMPSGEADRDGPSPADAAPPNTVSAAPLPEPGEEVLLPREARGDEVLNAAIDSAMLKTVAGPSTAEGDVAVPVYRTRPAPPATLSYDMRRGFFSGTGQLTWRLADQHYELRLDGRVAGLQVITQVSSGDIDEHGIAPLRFTDQRLRRAPNAANFQRDKRKITYSGPQVEFPLVPGAQDRLSWMLQIGAILNADPQLASPGARITFFVTGARGDADVWSFRYIGSDELRSDNGPIRAVKFTREPRRPYDSLVEVWLAPERHHLPVRARVTADSSNDVFELLLRDMRFP